MCVPCSKDVEKIKEEIKGAEFLGLMAILECIGRNLMEISRHIKKIREKSGEAWHHVAKVLKARG
ncbi:MAG: hypothetical protein DRO12_06470 [Thermoprotei archaeon]|nr:MAG: hypothetical protein DRO12_06470 [Thermoprotei archaeon]